MIKLKRYAWVGLIFSLLGYVPKIGNVFSLLGFLGILLMYRELEQMKLSKKISKLYLLISVLTLLAILIFLFGWEYGRLIGGALAIIAYALVIYIAWLSYLFSFEIRRLAQSSGSKLLKIAAVMMRISAFSTPLLIGFLLQALTQLVILFAVLRYQPKAKIESIGQS